MSAPLGARGVLTPVPDRHHPHQAPREVWAHHAVTRHPCHPNGTYRQRSAAAVWLLPPRIVCTGLPQTYHPPFPLSCSYGCLSLWGSSHTMRHLWSLSTASLVPLVRHGGRFAQSGKDPRALLVPSYTTATTAKTAPVGLCGPVWPPGGGIIYGRRHVVADVAMDATVDGREDRQHESTREHRADTARTLST